MDAPAWKALEAIINVGQTNSTPDSMGLEFEPLQLQKHEQLPATYSTASSRKLENTKY